MKPILALDVDPRHGLLDSQVEELLKVRSRHARSGNFPPSTSCMSHGSVLLSVPNKEGMCSWISYAR